LPPPGDAGQRGNNRLLRLGDQLPRVQGHRGAGHAVERPERLAARLRRADRALAPDRGRGGARRMSTTIFTLRRMANDIARNLAAMGHDKAVLATADHIDKFWDPR